MGCTLKYGEYRDMRKLWILVAKAIDVLLLALEVYTRSVTKIIHCRKLSVIFFLWHISTFDM